MEEGGEPRASWCRRVFWVGFCLGGLSSQVPGANKLPTHKQACGSLFHGLMACQPMQVSKCCWVQPANAIAGTFPHLPTLPHSRSPRVTPMSPFLNCLPSCPLRSVPTPQLTPSGSGEKEKKKNFSHLLSMWCPRSIPPCPHLLAKWRQRRQQRHPGDLRHQAGRWSSGFFGGWRFPFSDSREGTSNQIAFLVFRHQAHRIT